MTETSNKKDELRQAMLERRLALSADEVSQMGSAIQDRVLKHKLWANAERVGLYSAVKNEVETTMLFHKALEQGKSLYYPRVEQGLNFYEVHERGDLHKGAWGILEPKHGCQVLMADQKLDLLIVPGVVFDVRGFRIGYGKGFYDIYLASMELKAFGLGYDFQMVPEIPADNWDRRVGSVLTEKREYIATTKG